MEYRKRLVYRNNRRAAFFHLFGKLADMEQGERTDAARSIKKNIFQISRKNMGFLKRLISYVQRYLPSSQSVTFFLLPSP